MRDTVPPCTTPARHEKPKPAWPAVVTVSLGLLTTAANAQETTATLQEITVQGESMRDLVGTEGTGSYTPRATGASTGLPLTLRETPQSVTVITRQRIEDQDMRSLTDIMANTPGISVQNYDSERYSFNARGFSITNYMFDGVPTAFDTGYAGGESSLDPIIYDRVEVVRGATGLLTGAGNPSASINLVRKHATSKEFKADVSVSAGTHDNYRGTLDLSTPLSESGHVRGRIVAAYQDSGSFLDNYDIRKRVFYGVVDADLTDSTTISAGFNYQDNDPRGSSWGGFPLWYSDGTRTNWRRSLNTGADWTSWGSRNRGAFLSLKQALPNDWHLDVIGTHTRADMDAKLLYLYGFPDRTTGLGVNPSPAWYEGSTKQNGIDMKLSGPFSLFGRQHEAVFGVSYTRQYADYSNRSAEAFADVGNFLEWDNSYPEPEWSNSTTPANKFVTKQAGYYGALRFSLADPLTLILGGRYSTWKTDATGWGGESHQKFDKTKFVPYAGLLYDINDTYTAYVSYTEIFNPQAYQDRNGNWLPPLEGKAYEAGIKAEFLDGMLNASAAIFQIDQDNVAQTDTGYMVPGTPNEAYYAAQGTRSRGYELELTGRITEAWNIAGGLSHWTARDGNGNAIQTDQPRTLIRVFTTYRLPGQLNKLTIGGGVNWQSKTYTIASGPNGDEAVSQGSYALANLMARYQFNRNLSAQLNVNNLFDKKYYSQIGFYNQGAWGAGRTVMLTMRYQY